MKKNIKVVNKFNRYANHLINRQKSNKEALNLHNMKVEKLCSDFENFYALNPDFYVEECNQVLKSLDDDYNNYIKWLVDDKN